MSTKIYTAYRVRTGHDVWDVAQRIRRRAEREVSGVLRKFYEGMMEPGEVGSGFLEEFGLRRPDDYLEAGRIVRAAYIKRAGNPLRDIFDLDVSIALRRSGTRWLLIPYPGSGLFHASLDFLRRDRALEDYHYQNATDRPEHISARAWASRRRAWERLLDHDEWRHKLVLDIVSIDGWFNVCPSLKMALEQPSVPRRDRA